MKGFHVRRRVPAVFHVAVPVFALVSATSARAQERDTTGGTTPQTNAPPAPDSGIAPEPSAAPPDHQTPDRSATTSQLEAMSLSEIMNIKVSIASKTEQKQEEAASIISVITRQDIINYGARDVVDILRLVPGFEFAQDVYGVYGVSFRGIWVYEGKINLMINGLPMNDFAYGNVNLFGSMPASIIERVEIIRGPGSALYGGLAEVTSINIITQKGESLNGVQVYGDMGFLGKGEVSRNGMLQAGARTEDGLDVAATVGYGLHPLSTKVYHDWSGNSLQLGESNSSRQWRHIIMSASYKGLVFNYKRTDFDFYGQDGFTTIFPQVNGQNAERLNFSQDGFLAKYEAKLPVEGLKVTPVIEYDKGNPIATAVLPASIGMGQWENTAASYQRYRGELAAIYDHKVAGQFTVGGGYIRDTVKNLSNANEPGLQVNDNPVTYATTAKSESRYVYAQYIKSLFGVGATLGGRYENTTFGNALAPRAGLTYVNGDFNAKLLYGRAFRIPFPWQAYSRFLTYAGGSLEPETADTYEVEAGYKLTNAVRARANFFYVDIASPIVYNGADNTYRNSGRIRALGTEAEVDIRYPRYGGFANLSFNKPGSGTSQNYITDNQANFLGAPPLKVNLAAYYNLWKLTFAPSVTFLSRRYGQSDAFGQDTTGTMPPQSQTYPALALVNMNIVWRNVVSGIDVNVSGHNLLDSNYVLLQPYYGKKAPLPVNPREIGIGVRWTL